MTSQPKIDAEQTDTTLNTPRKPYRQPQLQRFGSVGALTQSGATGDPEQAVAGSMTRSVGGSDRRIKRSIVRVGNHPLGIGLYLFDYKPEFRDAWGHGRQFGVMADEVEEVMPEAVSVHPDGYKMVDYALLGISRSLH
jgi:hypothetical protein